MPGKSITVLLLFLCTWVRSQELHFTRTFPTLKKNVPLAILNNHGRYFHLLRYNKTGHDFTLERRSKPSADILTFTPLRLDSINASWFDLEELDYLLFENNSRVYLVFEKELNSRKTIYIKSVDTNGRASPFIELASMEGDNNTAEYHFSFSKTENANLLIIASRITYSGLQKKVALLYDPASSSFLWTRKLPMESAATDFSDNFVCTRANELCYMLTKNTITGFDTYYGYNGQYSQPILLLDSLILVKCQSDSSKVLRKTIRLKEVSTIKGLSLVAAGNSVLLQLRGVDHDSIRHRIDELVVNYMVDSTFTNTYRMPNKFDTTLTHALSFYDGQGEKAFWTKTHDPMRFIVTGSQLHSFFERTDGYFKKELLYFRTDLTTGKIVRQCVIPRKIMFFGHRNRFKSAPLPVFTKVNNQPALIILENPGNVARSPEPFIYDKFSQERNLWNSNMMLYSFDKNAKLTKRLLYHNKEFDLVPLIYSSRTNDDIVLYFNADQFEKFAITQFHE